MFIRLVPAGIPIMTLKTACATVGDVTLPYPSPRGGDWRSDDFNVTKGNVETGTERKRFHEGRDHGFELFYRYL